MADADSVDLEYHITFPSPVSPDIREEESDSTFTFEDTNVSEPVVILLGWAGCEDKHLQKYSGIYDRSCITIRYTAPTKDIFFSPQKLKGVAAKLLDLVEELSLEQNPIFIHAFSNGGGFVYRYITKLIHSDKRYSHIKIQGVIFDSCPSQKRIHIAVKAFMATLQRNILVKYALGTLLYMYLFFTSILKFVRNMVGLGDGSGLGEGYWEDLLDDPSRCPQMYLYSTADKIVSCFGVQEHIQFRMKLGVKVHSVCWDDSDHVQHLRLHRESYIQNCEQFIGSCLGKSI